MQFIKQSGCRGRRSWAFPQLPSCGCWSCTIIGLGICRTGFGVWPWTLPESYCWYSRAVFLRANRVRDSLDTTNRLSFPKGFLWGEHWIWTRWLLPSPHSPSPRAIFPWCPWTSSWVWGRAARCCRQSSSSRVQDGGCDRDTHIRGKIECPWRLHDKSQVARARSHWWTAYSSIGQGYCWQEARWGRISYWCTPSWPLRCSSTAFRRGWSRGPLSSFLCSTWWLRALMIFCGSRGREEAAACLPLAWTPSCMAVSCRCQWAISWPAGAPHNCYEMHCLECSPMKPLQACCYWLGCGTPEAPTSDAAVRRFTLPLLPSCVRTCIYCFLRWGWGLFAALSTAVQIWSPLSLPATVSADRGSPFPLPAFPQPSRDALPFAVWFWQLVLKAVWELLY